VSQTKIEWADKVWNPITGCSHAGSPGCDNCYAKRMAYRLKGRYGYPKDDPFRVTFHADRLDEPLRWKKPSRIFVCSMGDLFHKDVKEGWFIPIIHKIRLEAKQHTYLFLTKRPQNIEHYLSNWFLPNMTNVWLGVSVEDQKTVDERIPILLQIPTVHHWVNIEPMLGPVDLTNISYKGTLKNVTPEVDFPFNVKINALTGDFFDGWDSGHEGKLDWVVLGCESGPKRRPCQVEWIRDVKNQCVAAGVPFFLKQMEVNGKVVKMPELDGRIWDEMPI
jgi:protein gp37